MILFFMLFHPILLCRFIADPIDLLLLIVTSCIYLYHTGVEIASKRVKNSAQNTESKSDKIYRNVLIKSVFAMFMGDFHGKRIGQIMSVPFVLSVTICTQ